MNTRIKYLFAASLILAVGISFIVCLQEDEDKAVDPSMDRVVVIKKIEIFTNSENKLVGVFDMANKGDNSVYCYVGGDYRGVTFYSTPSFKKRNKTGGVWEDLDLSYGGAQMARKLEPGDVARFQVDFYILTEYLDYKNYEYKLGMEEFWSDTFVLP